MCHLTRDANVMFRIVLGAAILIATADVGAAQTTSTPTMEKVSGIGGVFFRSRDHVALQAWYEKHLGIPKVPTSYDVEPWSQEAGFTVFAPFPEATDYFGKREQQWMLNFRVRNLDAMVRQLRAAGIEVTVDPKEHPNGRFARLHDPEGNPIELWEPKRPERRP
jgi:glyoxylase I family protein